MLNEVHLLGRIGQQPEIRILGVGAKVASLSMATTEKWNDDKGEKQERTEWHNLEAWNGLANTVESCVHKGDLLHIKGKLQTDSYEKDGQKHYRTKVRITTLNLMPQGGGTGLGKEEKERLEKFKLFESYMLSMDADKRKEITEGFNRYKAEIGELPF